MSQYPGEGGLRPLRAAPELLASIFSLFVVAFLAVALLIPGNVGGGLIGPPAATPTNQPEASSEPIDVVQARFARTVVEKLISDRTALTDISRASPFDATEAAAQIRQLSADSRVSLDMANQLQRIPGTTEFGVKLETVVTAVQAETSAVLALSPASAASSYAKSTTKLIADLAPLTELRTALDAYIDAGGSAASASASPTASASASPGGSGAPSAAASPTPAASASAGGPTPSASGSAVPTAAPTGPELLQNGSFESSAAGSWQLTTLPPAAASIAFDTSNPSVGNRSARVTITSSTEERASVSVAQSGLALAPGVSYRCVISFRAATAREVRVRIVSADGSTTYVARVATVGTTWTPLSFDFTAFQADPSAMLAIDLGRSNATTWIDGASLRALAG